MKFEGCVSLESVYLLPDSHGGEEEEEELNKKTNKSKRCSERLLEHLIQEINYNIKCKIPTLYDCGGDPFYTKFKTYWVRAPSKRRNFVETTCRTIQHAYKMTSGHHTIDRIVCIVPVTINY